MCIVTPLVIQDPIGKSRLQNGVLYHYCDQVHDHRHPEWKLSAYYQEEGSDGSLHSIMVELWIH